MERFRDRQRIYRRREQLTIWVGAGIGGIVAIASAHLLDGRPQLLVQSIFTFAVVAGVAWAFSRVQFEWLATNIDREIEDNVVQRSTPFPAARLNEDRMAEFLWSMSLWTMAAGWLLVLLSVWLTSASAATPCQVCVLQRITPVKRQIQHFIFPRFAIGDANLEHEDFPAQQKIQEVALAWKKGREQGDDGIVFVIGSTDRLPLRDKSRIRFGGDVGLARARAESVAEAVSNLAKKLSPQNPLPDDRFIMLVSGPRNTPGANESQKTGFPEDRRVDVWIFWFTGSSNQLVASSSKESNTVDTQKNHVRALRAVWVVTSLLLLRLLFGLLAGLRSPKQDSAKGVRPGDSKAAELKPLLRLRMYTKVAAAERGIYLEVTNLDDLVPAVQLKAFAKLAAPEKEEGVSLFFPTIAEVRPQSTIHVSSLTGLDDLLRQFFGYFDPSTVGIASTGEGGDFEAFNIELRCSYMATSGASPEIQVVLEQSLNVRRKS